MRFRTQKSVCQIEKTEKQRVTFKPFFWLKMDLVTFFYFQAKK